MVVSSLLLGQFPWKRCPRFCRVAGHAGVMDPAAETDSDCTELVPGSTELLRLIWTVRSWSLLVFLVLGVTELLRLSSTV